MSKRRLLQNQPKIKVIAQAQDNSVVWGAMLVSALAGIFYFFGFFFGDALGRALSGG